MDRPAARALLATFGIVPCCKGGDGTYGAIMARARIAGDARRFSETTLRILATLARRPHPSALISATLNNGVEHA